MSNLTVSTGEESGSLIQCSLQSSFGFRLKNATNVTLTGININCGSVMGLTIKCFGEFSCSVDSCQTPILIETSRHINIAQVRIDHSPGLAMDNTSDEPIKTN